MEPRGLHRPRRWRREPPWAPSLRDSLALSRAGTLYWLGIHPQVSRELAGWELRARRIPNQMLRDHALGQLAGERLNPEAAALFAVLAPRAQRRRAVRFIVAYQVLYDYLDAVNEEPGLAALSSGLQLNRALTDAVLAERPMGDYYPHRPGLTDGGYMHALAEQCRRVVQRLPAATRSAQVLVRASERCAQAQSHNHATLRWGQSRLVEWSLAQAPADGRGYEWWELAAGGISCLAIHALVASAADPASDAEEAAALDAAYFPAICALSSLLDSLADYHSDAGSTNHSFVSHYRDSAHAGERLVAIATDAADRLEGLRNRRLHAIILAGIASYYLSSPSVRQGFPAPVAERLVGHVGALGTPMRMALRVRRRLHARATAAHPGAERTGPRQRIIPAGPAARARARR
jgi:tetraprenyl-beta-curcumene synthase